jgi:hypothetical protein
VRPATTSETSSRSTVCSATDSSPATVRCPGWTAQPANGPPS